MKLFKDDFMYRIEFNESMVNYLYLTSNTPALISRFKAFQFIALVRIVASIFGPLMLLKDHNVYTP